MSVRLPVNLRQTVGAGISVALLVAATSVTEPCHAQVIETPMAEQQPAPGVVEAFDIGAVPARCGALLLSGQAGGDVEGALIWTVGAREENDRVTVPFVVEVNGESLLAGDGATRAAIGFYAYVVDDGGVVIDHVAQGLVVDPGAFRDRIIANGLKFFGRIALPLGEFTLRVMVEDRRTGNYYMSWNRLTLPDPEDSIPYLLPPLFPDTGSHWAVVRQQGMSTATVLGTGGSPLPSARPALVEDQTAEVWLGGSDWDEGDRVGVRIVDDIGRTVSEPGVEVSGPTVGDFAFRRATLTAIDLPAGNYTLIVTLSDQNGGEMLRRPLPVTVVRAGDPVAWASARPTVATGAESVVGSAVQQKGKIDKEALRAAYRRALVQLGEGDRVAARRSVMELERDAVANPSSKAVKTLAEVEFAEAKALAEQNPDSLLPIVFLHRELCRSYSARHEGILEYHSREITIALASLSARLQPDNPFPLGLMVNLAGDFARMGASGAARRLLEQTLVFSPEYQPALLALGFSFEQNGEYGKAVAIFQRLVDAYPDDSEGRLRLAVNLIRTGRDERGEEILRDLIESQALLWIRTIAAQELIRSLVGAGSLVEAEQAVHLALERVPEDQRLWILLAAIMEETNRHGEAIGVVERLPPASPGISARARYAEWPAPSAEVSLTSLMAQAAAATAVLQSTLARQGGRG